MVLWLAILGFPTHRGVYHLPNPSRLVSYQGHNPLFLGELAFSGDSFIFGGSLI